MSLLLLSLSSQAQQDKKSEKARKNVAEANKELREARLDSAADYNQFKKEAELAIVENQKKIAELRADKAMENKETKEKYAKKVSELEQKNNELKHRINSAETTKTDRWSSFKREFSHDMTELGQSIRDLGVNNKK